MSDQVAPILLTVVRGKARSFCIANIVRGDDGELYAEPFIWPPEEIFGHLGRLKLVGHAILPPQDIGGGSQMHTYQGTVTLPE